MEYLYAKKMALDEQIAVGCGDDCAIVVLISVMGKDCWLYHSTVL